MVNKKPSSSYLLDEDQMPETDVSREFLNFMLDELMYTYWSEKHLAKAIPKIQKACTTTALKDAFSRHLAASRLQVERLDEIFQLLGETPRAKKCEAMASLVEKAIDIIEETGKGTHLRDAGLVLAAQKIEHYQIATCLGLVQLARKMGNEDIISLLEETLSEKTEAGDLLSAFAEGGFADPPVSERIERHMEEVEKIAVVYDSVNLTGKNKMRV